VAMAPSNEVAEGMIGSRIYSRKSPGGLQTLLANEPIGGKPTKRRVIEELQPRALQWDYYNSVAAVRPGTLWHFMGGFFFCSRLDEHIVH